MTKARKMTPVSTMCTTSHHMLQMTALQFGVQHGFAIKLFEWRVCRGHREKQQAEGETMGFYMKTTVLMCFLQPCYFTHHPIWLTKQFVLHENAFFIYFWLYLWGSCCIPILVLYTQSKFAPSALTSVSIYSYFIPTLVLICLALLPRVQIQFFELNWIENPRTRGHTHSALTALPHTCATLMGGTCMRPMRKEANPQFYYWHSACTTDFIVYVCP